MVVHISSENFKEEVLKESKTVVLDFFAKWCMPCRMISPIIEEISDEMNDTVKVCKIDVDEAPDLARQYRVLSIPTVLVVKGGEEVKRSIGFVPKKEIADMIG
ncbi:MAG: thioredoxin [Lachnospiraceae bacterium]|nr:thioredoxin [Lachnospiraceae bacterium]